MNDFRTLVESLKSTVITDVLIRQSRVESPGTNARYYAQMLASQRAGGGAMPSRLGLACNAFSDLLDRHFHDRGIPYTVSDGERSVAAERVPEWDELCDLLNRYRVYNGEPQTWMTTVIATACMGQHHLWQDLGLWNRKALSSLMNDNFPELAGRNTGDMKWKKFIYKQLCEEEGIYVCRAPSCEVCSDYRNCFGPEE